MAPAFYVTQFGAIWRVTRAALERILRDGAEHGGYSIDGEGVTRLAERFSEASYDRREGFLPRKWRSRRCVLLMPLDQTREWFVGTLDALRRGDYDEMRGFTPDEDLAERG